MSHPFAGFLLGLVGGFLFAIPPGPLSFAVGTHALAGRRASALCMSLGSSLTDSYHALLVALGSGFVLDFMRRTLDGIPSLGLMIHIVMIVAFATIGINYLRKGMRPGDPQNQGKKLGPITPPPFIVGLFMGSTNIVSPTFLPLLFSLVAYLHAESLLPVSSDAGMLFGVGFGCGTISWLAVIIHFLGSTRLRFHETAHIVANRITGVTFLATSCVLLVRLA
jgi:threonine/homoserine/homoserine lactone efflux protein